MIKRQVITFNTDGSIEGLDRKKGEGLNLKVFGQADVVRASQIEWHEGEGVRGYKIEFLIGHRKGSTLTVKEYSKYQTDKLPTTLNPEQDDAFALFEDYGECVDVEITILDDDRLNGIF